MYNFVIALLWLAFALTAKPAVVTYEYVGNDFDQFNFDSQPISLLDYEQDGFFVTHIVAFITLDTSTDTVLDADLNNTMGSSDPEYCVTPGYPPFCSFTASLTTDASGNVVSWDIFGFNAEWGCCGGGGMGTSSSGDYFSMTPYGASVSTPGTWSIYDETATPEPTTALLMLGGAVLILIKLSAGAEGQK